MDVLKKSNNNNNSTTGLSRKKYPAQFVFKIPSKSTYEITGISKDPTQSNSAVEIYFQVGKDNVYDRVLVDLLIEIMNEPLYNQIRTKDQFGYHVSCDSRWTSGIIGIQIVVVSSIKTVNEIKDRIEKFLIDFRQILIDLTDDDFIGHVIGLANEKLNMFNSLSEETSHLWEEIRNGRYQWEVDRDEVICLKTITKEHVLKAYDNWISPVNKTTRRQLIVKVVANEGPSSKSVERLPKEISIEDAESYNDNCVKAFHAFCKQQTFGRIY